MIKIENVEVPGSGFDNAIRGMRNPMNSWKKIDSYWDFNPIKVDSISYRVEDGYKVGPNDLDLMTRLVKAGSEHAKFMRMIVVYLDITAPLYWWKEFDTYKVGTVANSCSTMHKIAAKEFTYDDFSNEYLDPTDDDLFFRADSDNYRLSSSGLLGDIISALNIYRNRYNISVKKLKRKDLSDSERAHIKRQKRYYWYNMIQLLPTSYNQKRTIMLNYEVLTNIYRQRKGHKLDEWNDFCAWIETLPYSELITGEHNNDI